MEFNLRQRKVCPRCNTLVHVKRAVCGCGHAFASKRKAQCTTNESVKRKRASESEKETDKVRRARRRAWLGILYIHDTCFPKNYNTALICHNLCSRRGFPLQCFSLFKFRSGTHELNEELGRHRGGKGVCCVGMNVRVFVMYCENVQHIVLLELTFCRICRNALEIVLKLWIVQTKPHSSLWEEHFESLVALQ